MSAKATFWAWKQPIKPASAKLVLLCLADCHNADNGQCNPSVPYISRMTGLDRKTVISGIEKLEKMRIIKCHRRYGYSTQYHLHTHLEHGADTHPGIGTPRNGIPPENGTTFIPSSNANNGMPPLPETGHEPKKEPNKNRKSLLPADFSITDAMREWALEKLPGFDVDAEFEPWCDYWRGEGEVKADWKATWRNGMISRAARAQKNNPQQRRKRFL